MVGLEKEWSVNINKQLPINLQMSWQGDEEPISVAAFNFDISLFASSRGSIINLWEVNTGKKLHTFEGHKYDISSLAFSQDGKTIASGSMDNTIKVWDVSSGKLLHTLKKRLFFGDGHKEYVSSVTFSTNGKMIISGGADNTVKVWQVNKGEVLQTLKGHEDEVTSVAVRRRDDDILMIASGSKDKTIKLWFDGIPLYTFTGHQNSILSLAISPDGKLLASGSRDKTIKLWPTVPCQTPRTLEGHKAEVISLTFSPDGSLLASVSASEMKLWEVASGSLLYTIPEVVSKKTENFKSAVVFTPDGRKLALVNELNIIKIWGANPVE
ncbi:repeat-containing protein [Candidatus Thiomargarita nelsonii]|uniref:Repeat-containing protein n=1 Tax=Candidatus Thiomargarita nelsonii TaxID=1003181 RepID=A0A176RYI6_9GAMM|nr:repeat-containing protein [Candidatus Thiomargarita nelsonii]